MSSEEIAPQQQGDIVVIWVRRDTKCAECGEELPRGSAIRMSDPGPLCLDCAELGHLMFLASGDAALTRRAKKHSGLYAVVVQWSRTRKRYERQGLLVEEEALDRAEDECLADEEVRQRRRMREAERREALDQQYHDRFAARIRELYRACPAGTPEAIANHACRKHSGRVGRSAAAQRLDEEMVGLAVRAHIRHRHTRYDALLLKGWDRHEARDEVFCDVAAVEEQWRS